MLAKHTGAIIIALGAIFGGIACGELAGSGFDCTTQEQAYEETAATEGQLLTGALPIEGPFPMAMVLSQDGVNNLLSAVLDQQLDPVTISQSGVELTIQPSIPVIQLENFADCPTCVLADMALDIQRIEVPLLGNLGSASATASLGLPVSMLPKENNATGVMVQMNNATIRGLNLEVSGFNTSDVPGLEEILRGFATDYVRAEFGDTELMQLDSWKISDDVLLAARGPVIHPDKKTIVLGLHSNLSLPQTASLESQATLPEGSEMGLQFHPDLLLGMVQRLTTEGFVSRDFDAAGNAASNGDHHVSLMTMSTSDDSDDLLTSFRVWRTGGGLCGSADFTSALAAQITGDSVEFSAKDFTITGGDGVGQFLNESQWLAGDFIESMAESVALTVNYSEMGFSEKEKSISPKANSLTINGKGLSVYLNLGISGDN